MPQAYRGAVRPVWTSEESNSWNTTHWSSSPQRSARSLDRPNDQTDLLLFLMKPGMTDVTTTNLGTAPGSTAAGAQPRKPREDAQHKALAWPPAAHSRGPSACRDVLSCIHQPTKQSAEGNTRLREGLKKNKHTPHRSNPQRAAQSPKNPWQNLYLHRAFLIYLQYVFLHRVS